MTIDDIKGRTYTNQADFWRDIEQAFKEAQQQTTRKWKRKLAAIGDRLEEGDFEGHDDMAFVCEEICGLMCEMECDE